MDVRFGWFRYQVDVFPNDFGTNPALDAGIPGMNFPDDPFTSGLPSGFINGGAADMSFGTGLGDRAGRCNCPLKQDEQQFQLVSNFTKSLGDHTAKFGIDIRRAHNLRVPSDNHRSGEIDFNAERTQGPTGGGMGLATFLLGDVSGYRRYVSPSTDARERQWRWFVYAQDTWRATPKWTFNYGLASEDIMPQTVNEPGNAGFFDLATGEMKVAGVGGVGLNGDIKNKINLAPRLGITYQLNEKTVVRMGYGRSYDIGVFGSTFGHSVTQNLPVLARQTLNAPANFERIFTLRQGPPPPTFPAVGRERPLPGAGRREPVDPARAAAAALRGRLEPDRPARADAGDLGRDRLRRQQGHPRVQRATARTSTSTRPIARPGFPDRARATSAGPSSRARWAATARPSA